MATNREAPSEAQARTSQSLPSSSSPGLEEPKRCYEKRTTDQKEMLISFWAENFDTSLPFTLTENLLFRLRFSIFALFFPQKKKTLPKCVPSLISSVSKVALTIIDSLIVLTSFPAGPRSPSGPCAPASPYTINKNVKKYFHILASGFD